jgi:membrane-associated phospholipid phosphatase
MRLVQSDTALQEKHLRFGTQYFTLLPCRLHDLSSKMSSENRTADLVGAAFSWVVALATVVAATAICIRWIDYPTAHFLLASPNHGWIARFFGGRSLVAYETVMVGSLALARLLKGTLHPFGKVVLIASAASIITYAINDLLLKPFFGRLSPGDVNFAAIGPIFHYFQGSDGSSFPSGHMALAASFLAVVYRIYPSLRPAVAVFLLLGCLVLVIGDWHYVSDVIAGTFTGFAVGILTGELWVRHSMAKNVYL